MGARACQNTLVETIAAPPRLTDLTEPNAYYCSRPLGKQANPREGIPEYGSLAIILSQ